MDKEKKRTIACLIVAFILLILFPIEVGYIIFSTVVIFDIVVATLSSLLVFILMFLLMCWIFVIAIDM